MTFAQALARIEELAKDREGAHDDLCALLYAHHDSIVQLGKVAEKLASTVTAGAGIGARGERDLYQQARGLQALLKGDEG